jgi:hypothetical protein
MSRNSTVAPVKSISAGSGSVVTSNVPRTSLPSSTVQVYVVSASIASMSTLCSACTVSERITMRSGHGSVVGVSHATVIACASGSVMSAYISFTMVGNGVTTAEKPFGVPLSSPLSSPPLSSTLLSSTGTLSSPPPFESSPLHANAKNTMPPNTFPPGYLSNAGQYPA